MGEPKVVSRRREGEARQSEATKIMINNLTIIFSKIQPVYELKKTMIKSVLSGHTDRYHWQIGTCHVYKRSKQTVTLSRLADHLRKLGFSKILMTKELTDDRYPHYHFLVASPRKEGIHPRQPLQIKQLKNAKIWSRQFELGACISYASEYEIRGTDEPIVDFEEGKEIEYEYYTMEKPRYSCITKSTRLNTSMMNLDLGFKVRWLRYGLLNYIKYMFKYFDSTKTQYEDYYLKLDK